MASPIGGLYLEVKLDTKGATQALANLEQSAKRVLGSMRSQDLGLAKQARVEADAARKAYEDVAAARAKALSKPISPGRSGGGGGTGGDRSQLGAASLYGTKNEYALAKKAVLDYQAAVAKAWAQINGTTSKGAANTAKNNAKTAKAFTPIQKSLHGSRQDFEKWRAGVDKSMKGAQKSVQKAQLGIGQASLQIGSRFGGAVGALKTGNVGFLINNVLSGVSQMLGTLSKAGPIAAAAIIGITVALSAVIVPAAAVAASLKKVFDVGIEQGTKLQQTYVSMGAVLGKVRGEAEKEFLKEQAEGSIFSFGGLAELDRTLLAYNVLSDEIRRGAIKDMITLGTVAGKSEAQMSNAALALGQIYQSGSLRGPEVRQLVDSLGVGLDVFKELPQYAEKTTAELRKMQEEGLIPSVDLFEALTARASGYGPVVEEMANTLGGQLQKLRTDLPTLIGDAFVSAGALDPLTNIVKSVYETLAGIDWERIAAGFRNVFTQLETIVGGFLNNGGGKAIQSWFERVLPFVLEELAQGIRFTFELIRTAVGPLLEAFNAAVGGAEMFGDEINSQSSTIPRFVDVLSFMAQMVAEAIGQFRAGMSILQAFGQAIVALGEIAIASGRSIARALNPVNWLTGDVGDEVDGITSGFDAIGEAIDNAKAGITEAKFDTEKWRKEIRKVAREVEGIAKNDFDFTAPFPGLDGPGRTGEPPGSNVSNDDKTEEDAKKLLQNLDKLQKHINDLRTKLYDLTKRWFGMRSELERGFLGEEGFEASKSQIAGMGKQVIELLQGLGDFSGAHAVEQNTRMLLKLADARDEIAEKLEAAETKLKDAISARDDFADKIRQQSIDFVNALKLEEDEVEKIQRIDGEGVSGYLVYKVKETEQFIEAQRQRLEDLKEFQSLIRTLAAKGLDKGLLESLVSAGPDDALVVLRQLDAGGSAVIAEVNSIQKELGKVARELGDENARVFYQAGVDAAQAEADGLNRQAAFVRLAATNVTNQIYAVALPLAANMRNVGTSAGKALAAGIQAGAQLGVDAAKKASDASKLYALAGFNFQQALYAQVAAHQGVANAISVTQGAAAGQAYRANAANSIRQWAVGEIQSTPEIKVYIGDSEIEGIIKGVIDGNVRYSRTNGSYGAF